MTIQLKPTSAPSADSDEQPKPSYFSPDSIDPYKLPPIRFTMTTTENDYQETVNDAAVLKAFADSTVPTAAESTDASLSFGAIFSPDDSMPSSPTKLQEDGVKERPRSESTRKMYAAYQKHFTTFCLASQYSDTDIVNADKMYAFLSQSVVGRKSRLHPERHIGVATLCAYATSIQDMYQAQVREGRNTYPKPRDGRVVALIKKVKKQQTENASDGDVAPKRRRKIVTESDEEEETSEVTEGEEDEEDADAESKPVVKKTHLVKKRKLSASSMNDGAQLNAYINKQSDEITRIADVVDGIRGEFHSYSVAMVGIIEDMKDRIAVLEKSAGIPEKQEPVGEEQVQSEKTEQAEIPAESTTQSV